MTGPAPEFSRPVAVASLGAEPFSQEIEAAAAEREALARRFGLVALDRLTAVVALRRQSDGLILLEATFEAAFVQDCVVTLEPVSDAISHGFSLLYGPPEDEQAEIELDAEDPVFEPLTGNSIDVGEAVAQELSLALPEFPRDPDAVLDTAASASPEASAFAALQKLRGPHD